MTIPVNPVPLLVNHLWQSTLFAAGVWALTLALRRNQAHTRYRLWLLASAKFLVPFSILIAAGEQLQLRIAAPVAEPAFSSVMEGFAEPYPVGAATGQAARHIASADPVAAAAPVAPKDRTGWLPLLLLGVWGCGSLLLAVRWGRQWRRLHAAARGATPLMVAAGVPVLSTPTRMEPGAFGIVRPVLLLPQGIAERLTAPQLDAILAHELCHVRRRDNLTAAMHMVVELLFWFYPVVWWIRAGLMEERERACDEAVLDSSREAQVYAEGILNVCKFYVEAPMSCVAGVTGSELKKRIVRIMAEQMAHKLDLTRKLLLCLAAVLAVALPVSFGLVHAAEGQAQAAAQKMDIVGTWQGTLHVPAAAGRPGIDLRLVNKITKGDDGKLTVVDYSIDQGGAAMPASSASFQDGVFKFAIRAIDATYEGKLSGDGKSIAGTLTQGGNPLPLLFERATPETEWTIPPPPAKVPPMAANADPSFEVVTVKPSKPDEPGKLFTLRGDHVMTVNSTLMDLICSAYDVQQRQVAGGPSWMDSEKFDIDGKADVPGLPSEEQARIMLQKLLADRFQLKFHKSTKEMSAYLLTVAKGGPKMTQGDATGLPGIFFPGLGRLTVHDATMEEFASVMQSDVLDRPVVDQTGLAGRWNFLLKWTPDESQFGGMGIKVPPPSDAADAPPPLFTAIQEQIGLKLEAGKAQVPVLDIDQVEKPSAN